MNSRAKEWNLQALWADAPAGAGRPPPPARAMVLASKWSWDRNGRKHSNPLSPSPYNARFATSDEKEREKSARACARLAFAIATYHSQNGIHAAPFHFCFMPAASLVTLVQPWGFSGQLARNSALQQSLAMASQLPGVM